MLTRQKPEGGKATKDELKQTAGAILVQGNKITFTFRQVEELASTFRLDPSANPKAIDITHQGEPRKGKTDLAIYELNGDTLRICYGPLDGKRPTEFTARANSDHLIVVYRRSQQ